jgi:hypothetical protein
VLISNLGTKEQIFILIVLKFELIRVPLIEILSQNEKLKVMWSKFLRAYIKFDPTFVSILGHMGTKL